MLCTCLYVDFKNKILTRVVKMIMEVNETNTAIELVSDVEIVRPSMTQQEIDELLAMAHEVYHGK